MWFLALVSYLLSVWLQGCFYPQRWLWASLSAVWFGLWFTFGNLSEITLGIYGGMLLVAFLLFVVGPIRRLCLTKPLFAQIKKRLPKISATEAEALAVGDNWWEADLFRGQPAWQNLLDKPLSKLSAEEQHFLDHETSELCTLLDDWQIAQDQDLPPKVWQFMREKGFFGLVISKDYGGKGFSAAAHSAIVMKVASRSLTAAVTVMVPNSLGPGELLSLYGTQAQKDRYLPALAKGEHIPCFALTGPEVGSDATSMPDTGVVCKQLFEGKATLGIRLRFNKRYITLAPVATLIGLAFKLVDPDRLLGAQENIGITLALIPREHPGVQIGARHNPMGLAFMNGNIVGEDVFIPLGWVIGGQNMVGQGWRMLVECLSIGRSISLPALSTAFCNKAVLMTGAYATIRRQFRSSIIQMEGVAAKFAEIVGFRYLTEACRQLTLSAVDAHIKPAVASAIAKYHMTEMCRQVCLHAMDIHGGRGIMLGPKNYLAQGYLGMPVCITVEGANILTRNLMIFGQGSIGCHPYLYEEMTAVNLSPKEGLPKLDKLWLKHIGYLWQNYCRASWQVMTRGYFIRAPKSSMARAYQQLTWLSNVYAVVADIALITLGGALKRKENLSARLGDVLSYLYLASAALKQFWDDGEPKTDKPLVRWAVYHCLYQADQALKDFIANFPNKFLSRFLLLKFGLWRTLCHKPSDKLARQIIEPYLYDSAARRQIFAQTHYSLEQECDLVERCFMALLKADASLDKLKALVKADKVPRDLPERQQIQYAFEHKLLSERDYRTLVEVAELRLQAIQVDVFPPK